MFCRVIIERFALDELVFCAISNRVAKDIAELCSAWTAEGGCPHMGISDLGY
jgi:hypothetical protein